MITKREQLMNSVNLAGVQATWTIPFNRQWWKDDESLDLVNQAREEIEPFFINRDGVNLRGVSCGWAEWIITAWVSLEHLSAEYMEDIRQDLERKCS